MTPERSSKAVNKCIVDLSLGRNDLLDVVGRWGDVSSRDRTYPNSRNGITLIVGNFSGQRLVHGSGRRRVETDRPGESYRAQHTADTHGEGVGCWQRPLPVSESLRNVLRKVSSIRLKNDSFMIRFMPILLHPRTIHRNSER